MSEAWKEYPDDPLRGRWAKEGREWVRSQYEYWPDYTPIEARPYPNHIHAPDDGRGGRDVYVDGVKVDFCTYADLKQGFVRYNLRDKTDPTRARINRRRKDVRWAKKRGSVKVVLHSETKKKLSHVIDWTKRIARLCGMLISGYRPTGRPNQYAKHTYRWCDGTDLELFEIRKAWALKNQVEQSVERSL